MQNLLQLGSLLQVLQQLKSLSSKDHYVETFKDRNLFLGTLCLVAATLHCELIDLNFA